MEATKEVAATAKVLSNVTTVYVEVKSNMDGRTYSGNFTFKRLNIGSIAQVGVEACRLNGGLTVDENTDFLNTMLATFKYAVTAAPEWFKPEEMFDTHVVATVYNKYLEFEATFRRAVPQSPEATAEAGQV